jgi:hypothetical protein
MDFKLFKSSAQKLPTASEAELQEELDVRKMEGMPFPLHVFPKRLKPFIDALVTVQDCPPAFVGGSMLAVLSAAIGSYYLVSPKSEWEIPLTCWVCNVGISSGGKSMTEKFVVRPLKAIQKQMEVENTQADRDADNSVDEDAVKERTRKQEIIIQNTTFESLVREIMVDNPKGLLKHEDELTQWLDNMKAYSKTDMERKFWLSSWNLSPYKMNRSGGKRFFVEKPFCSVLGGTQPRYLGRFFSEDLMGDGFTVRMVFNVLSDDNIANSNLLEDIPAETLELWNSTIHKLFYDLEVRFNDEQKLLKLTKDALASFIKWDNAKREKINSIGEDAVISKEYIATAYGKIKEYAFKFAGILAVLDAYDRETFGIRGEHQHVREVNANDMERGLLLADYYLNSFQRAYMMSSAKLYVPIDVLDLARLFKGGMSLREIAKKIGRPVSTTRRRIEKYMREYPHAFGANVK